MDINFSCLTVLTFWLTLWIKIGKSDLESIPKISGPFESLSMFLLVKIIESFAKLGIMCKLDLVQKSPHKLVQTESEIQAILRETRRLLALDVSNLKEPKSFIDSILSLSEDGYTILGSMNPRFCFVITDPNKAKPFILLTALVTSFVACLHFIIANRRIPRFFPIFQDVPSSTERVSH